MRAYSVYLRRPPYLSILLIAVLIFQVSIVPDSLGVKTLGRMVNIIILFTFFILFMSTIIQNKHVNVYQFYIFPITLILIGYTINLFRNFDLEVLGWLSILFPWLSALSIPFNKKLNVSKSWEIFYRFLLITTVITLFEYVAVFRGMVTPTIVETDRGKFVKGIISIFYSVEGADSEIHYRFYGVFAEPGTAAMFLLIGFTYALVFSKKIGTLVFLTAIYLTDSLGGFVSAFIICLLFAIWKCNELRCSFPTKLLTITIVIFVSIGSIGYFSVFYEQKNASRTVREDNVTAFFHNLIPALMETPFGFDLKGKSLSDLESEKYYYGSNFTVYAAFVQGGVLGLLGYTFFVLMIVIITIKYFVSKYYESKLLACVFISTPALLIFIFQRTTILESALFSFLYASPIIKLMRTNRCFRDTGLSS